MDDYDFLSIERHQQPEGSHLEDVKKLVEGVRFVRTKIPATEIDDYLPGLRAIESKLNSFNEMMGKDRRNWISDIYEVLENEPEDDETVVYNVFEFYLSEAGDATFKYSGKSFYQNIIAEEWIKEQGQRGTKYIILKSIEA